MFISELAAHLPVTFSHWVSPCLLCIVQDEIIPVDGNVTENGIKADTNMEKVGKLPPAFIKPHGKKQGF